MTMIMVMIFQKVDAGDDGSALDVDHHRDVNENEDVLDDDVKMIVIVLRILKMMVAIN